MYETIIIGGGIAGMTAAIYASRKRMNFLMISKETGGQLFESGDILNYPGIIKTNGFELMKNMEEQLKANDVKVNENESVLSVKKIDKGFIVKTDKDEYETQTLLISTGARHRKLGVPGEKKFNKKGVTYCSVCDGPLFSGKDIVIVGGGNSALEAVDFTKDIVQKITMVNSLKDFTGHETLIENVQKLKEIDINHESTIKEIIGDQVVNAVVFKKKDGTEVRLDAEGIIIEIGRIPNTEFLKGVVEMDEHGHVQVDCHGLSSVDGIWAAGDCSSGHEYQYVIAAGQGAMALLKIARHLAGIPDSPCYGKACKTCKE